MQSLREILNQCLNQMQILIDSATQTAIYLANLLKNLDEQENSNVNTISDIRTRFGIADSQLNNLKSSDNTEGEKLKRGLKNGEGSFVERQRKTKKGITKFYQGSFTVDNLRHYVYAHTQSEIIQKIKTERIAAIYSIHKPTIKQDKRLTFEKWFKTYYSTYKSGKFNRERYEKNYNTQSNIIVKYFDKTALEDITEIKIENFLKTISAGQQTKFYDILNNIFKKAVANQKTSFNPCAALDRPKYNKKKMRAYEYHEQEIMLNMEKPYNDLFFFLCTTGLRIGEFLALTPEDIKKDYLIISKSKDNTGKILQGTKNGKTRNVYFLPELFQKFDKNLIGTFNYNSLIKIFSKIYKKFGNNINLHSTRHTYASVAHTTGIKDLTIMNQLGHSSLSVTQNTYTNILYAGKSDIKEYFIKLKEKLETIYS